MRSRPPLLSYLFFLVLLCSGPCRGEALPEVTSGTYKLDPRHSSVIFKISHLGFSNFVGRFDKMEGSLDYVADHPEKSTIDVTLYPSRIDTNDDELDETLRSENWFDALKYPRATFHATRIEILDDHKFSVIGDFTLHGQTHTLVLDATLVGSGKSPLGSEEEVIGINARGTFKRSAFDIDNLEPFVGDDVKLDIDAEFDKGS